MEKQKHLFIYEGPVKSFGKIIDDYYREGSYAVSPEKAISNIKFNYKRDNKLEPTCKIELTIENLRLEY